MYNTQIELVYMQWTISESQALFWCFVLIILLRMASYDTLLLCSVGQQACFFFHLKLFYSFSMKHFYIYKLQEHYKAKIYAAFSKSNVGNTNKK